MAANVIDIEVGDQLIKVCRAVRKGKGVGLSNSFMFRTPDNCVSDGVITNSELLSSTLKEQLASHGMQGARSVCFSLFSTKIAVREVKLPPLKGKQLGDAIRTNSEEYFPVDLKNYYITYSQLEYVSGPNSFIRVLVMAAPLSLLEGYFQLADKAGLAVRSIDSCGNSQYQVLKRLGGRGVTIYTDIGASSSLVSFLLEDNLLLQRAFTYGADELVSHYMAVSGKDAESYLDALRETDVTSLDFAAENVLSQDDIHTDLNHLVGGIMRSLDYFNSCQWEHSVSRIVLMGSNRHIVGLRELVAESTGIDTLYLDDVPEFSSFTGGSPDAPTYISCIGCQLAPLDFMPKNLVRRSGRRPLVSKDVTMRPGIIICSGLILCGLLSAGFSIFSYRRTVSELESAQQQITELEGAEKVYNTYISYQKGEKALSEVSANSDTPNSKLVDFYEELEEKMPSSILLLSATCTDETVSMNITVRTYNDAAYAISALRGFESLSSVEVSDITKEENDVGEEVVTFTANCTYGANPYTNNENPYASYFSPSPSPSSQAGGSSSTDSSGASTGSSEEGTQ